MEFSWRQDDGTHATPAEAAAEIAKQNELLPIQRCIMLGQVVELEVQDPPAWLLRCDGAEYLRVDYPELYAVIRAEFIVDADHFVVPQRDRRIGIDGITPALQGGENTHTLTEAEMPAHTHTEGIASPIAINGGLEAPAASAIPAVSLTGSTGGGAAHNNMQAYEGSQFFIVARYPRVGE